MKRWAKNNASTIVLVVAMAGLGGYLYATRHAVTTNESKGREINLVKVFRADDLSEIVITRAGQKARLTRRIDAGAGDDHLWHLEQDGKSELADQFAVDSALRAIEYAYPVRSIKKEEVDRARFGLEKPRLVIAMTMGKITETLSIGGDAPTPAGAEYVDVNGDVSVVKRETLSQADVPIDSFRTRQLVPYLSSELASFVIETGGDAPNKQVLERGPGSTWRFGDDGGGVGRVDRASFDKLLTSFADLKADSFLTDDDAKGAQAGAKLVTLTMHPTDRQKPDGKLVLGGECPGHPADVVVIRVAPSPLAACAAKSAYERLIAGAMPDRHLFSFREDEIEEILLESGDKKLDLARKDKGYHERSPRDADIPLDQTKTLLKALATTAAEREGKREDKVAALEPPRGKATLHATGQASTERPPEIVIIGREEADGSVPVRREQDGIVLRIRRDEARALLPRETSLRSTKIVDVGVEHAQKLRVTWGEGGKSVVAIERKEGLWTLAEPKGFPIDVGTTSSMVETATHLTADSWVADKDDGTFGLAKPSARYELVTDEGDGGTKTLAVLFGASSPLGIYGEIEGEDGVFVVPRANLDSLEAWPLDLAVFVIEPSDVTTLTLSTKKQSLTLVSDHDAFRVQGNGPPLSNARLDAIKGALHDFRASEVVHLGAPEKAEGIDSPVLEIKATRTNGKPLHILVGAGDAFHGDSIHYAKREDLDAVYAIATSRVRALLASFLAWRSMRTPRCALLLLFAGCAGGGARSSAPAAPMSAAWSYSVIAGEGARELVVDATFRAGSPEELGVDSGAEPFVHDLAIERDGTWQPIAPRGTSWIAPACPFGCRVRYRFDLQGVARALDDVDRAQDAGGAFLAPASTWLLHPLSEEGPGTFRVSVTTPPGISFVSGLARVPGEKNAYGASIDDLPESPYSAFGQLREYALDVRGSRLDVAFTPGKLAVSDDRVLRWIETNAKAVASFYGRFPVPRVEYIVTPVGGRNLFGKTLGNGGASIVIVYGAQADEEDLAKDWIMAHETIHLAFPSVPRHQSWMEEGLSTYIEPIARARRGLVTPEQVFYDFVLGMPNGEPEAGDLGLDRTPTWGRTYWGGAMFCLLADVRIRERSGGKKALVDALRGILDAGGNIYVRWPLEKALEIGDRAVGQSTLHELYEELGKKSVNVDLAALWTDLGVKLRGQTVAFDDGAKLAWIRRAMTAPGGEGPW